MAAAFAAFCEENRDWLEDYALFMALKARSAQEDWLGWDAPVRDREPGTLAACRTELAGEIRFHKLCQFFFFPPVG